MSSIFRHIAIVASKTHAVELTRVAGTASMAVIRNITLEDCVTAESKIINVCNG